MPQGKTSTIKITTVELPKTSYAGYWAGLTFHRGYPIPPTPLTQRHKIRMRGDVDDFVLLRGEGQIDHEYKSRQEEFSLNNQNASGNVDFAGAGEGAINFYAVAPKDAVKAVKLNVIEEA